MRSTSLNERPNWYFTLACCVVIFLILRLTN